MSPPGDRREPLADTKCPPAAQRKQAKRACNTLSNIKMKLRILFMGVAGETLVVKFNILNRTLHDLQLDIEM